MNFDGPCQLCADCSSGTSIRRRRGCAGGRSRAWRGGDHRSGALVAAIGERRGGAHGGLGAGFLPAAGVMAIAGQRSADHDDQAGDGVDHGLMGSRVAVVLGLFGDRMVASGHQGAVHDEHGVLAEPPTRLEREPGAEVVNDAVGRGLRDAEERGELAHRQVCASVRCHEQHAVFQRQTPRTAPPHHIRAFPSQRGHQPAEAARAQPSEWSYPGRLGRRDHDCHSASSSQGKIASP